MCSADLHFDEDGISPIHVIRANEIIHPDFAARHDGAYGKKADNLIYRNVIRQSGKTVDELRAYLIGAYRNARAQLFCRYHP